MWPLITVKNDKHHFDAFTSEFTASRPKGKNNENERVRENVWMNKFKDKNET